MSGLSELSYVLRKSSIEAIFLLIEIKTGLFEKIEILKNVFEKSDPLIKMYSKELIRSLVFLSEEYDTYWNIVDQNQEDELVMVHFDYDKIDLIVELESNVRQNILSLKGTILHVPTGLVVCRNLRYTPECTVEYGVNTYQNGVAVLNDNTSLAHAIDFGNDDTINIFPCQDGCIIRISKFKGKIYLSSTKKIDTNHSHWGKSTTFAEIYKELGGIDPEKLFPDEPTCNQCHVFILNHPDLSVASRQVIGDGYLVYMGALINNLDPNSYSINGFEPSEYSLESNIDNFKSSFKEMTIYNESGQIIPPYVEPTKKGTENFGKIVIPASFGRDKFFLMNILLISGYTGYDPSKYENVDPRFIPGESVHVTFTDTNGVGKMIRINSVAYNWRKAVQGNDSSWYHRFYCCFSYALKSQKNRDEKNVNSVGSLVEIFDGRDKDEKNSKNGYLLDQLFPLIATPTIEEFISFKSTLEDEIAQGTYIPPTIEDIKKFSKDVITPNMSDDIKTGLYARNIAALFILATPASKIIESLDFFSRFSDERIETLNFLINYFTLFKTIPKDDGKLPNGLLYYGYIDVMDNPEVLSGKSLMSFEAFTKNIGGKLELNQGGKSLLRLFKESVKKAVASANINAGDKYRAARFHISKTCIFKFKEFYYNEFGHSLYAIVTAIEKYKQSDDFKEKMKLVRHTY